MLEDSPDLEYDDWYKTFWTKRGREWGPFEEDHDISDTESTKERPSRSRPRLWFVQ